LAANISFHDFQGQAFEVDSRPAQAHDLADTKTGTTRQKDHTDIGMDELVEQRPIDATLKDFASERREGCEYYEQQTIGGLQCWEKIA
jgi:hypothetical protein